MARRIIVGVIGGNGVAAPVVTIAKTIGSEIARRDMIVLTGGHPSMACNVKDAAMQGAVDAQAEPGVIARLISILPNKALQFVCPSHRLILELPLTNYERDPINGLTPDCLIVCEGGTGTLCELGFALLACKPRFYCASTASLSQAFSNTRIKGDLLTAFGPALAKFPQPNETPTTMMGRVSAELTLAQDFSGSIQELVGDAIRRVVAPGGPSDFPSNCPGNQATKQAFESRLINL
jgi:hypothetical protein